MNAPFIASRFCGPPRSANGGYACGVAATELGSVEGASVRLLAPPPLEESLEVQRDDASVTLIGPDGPCLVVTPARPDPVVPDPVSIAEAHDLADGFDVADYRSTHVFPGCFTCGPSREPEDGLRLFPAPVGRDGLVAWPWTPTPTVADSRGRVDPLIVWAALDCPSGLAHVSGDSGEEVDAVVLGQLSVRIDRSAPIGEPLVAAGWPIAAEGRRRTAGSVLWDEQGDVVATAEAVWIVLTPEQATAFAS